MTSLEVLEPGAFTTVQDHPGRVGYWMVGVPPSGPMDDLSARLVTRSLGNRSDAALLECTATGPSVRFDDDVVVCIGGAVMDADLDGRPVAWWQPFEVRSGQVLRLRRLTGAGLRTYLGVRGGFDVTEVLGSRSTFTLGRFGGHEGRMLVTGDVLPVGSAVAPGLRPSPVVARCWPRIERSWRIGVLEGPHAAPEFFTAADVDALFAAEWRVQSHCARTGVRLDGPKPKWARPDGGEAGLHPSNIHDTGYAFGTIDFTGDTPVLLGPDGPSLGGFTCPATVVAAERWKLGQLAPGDSVTFVPIAPDRAAELGRRSAQVVSTLRPAGVEPPLTARRDPASGIVASAAGSVSGDRPSLTVRRSGDAFVLVEYGEMTLDLALRARVHALDRWLAERVPDAVVDVTPGIRSLLLQHDPALISTAELVELVEKGDDELPPTDELAIAARTVHLPLSWEDPATLEAIRRYMDVVRDDAPWCPSNLEFIRRVNGLDSVDDVHRIVFDARYLVLGLGDVYLGAPVATPLDPRHRLVTTKYNPARTWTPENAVGIGGAYLCVYGMEGPGGYQFVGRTVPVWYLDVPTPGDEPDVPWLLRPFDQIRFHPVDADELLDLRARATAGELAIEIEPTTFRLADHQSFLAAESDDIDAFQTDQRAAFQAERARWKASGEL
ncbi:MAG TPA: 5-oxoprolinase/urea amidolyase family protein [Iamia sp.]|jgi:urea carboxylase|nr:5-oxoprolinase/urea amidolyase family protein [Iamia sp.]